VQKPVKCGKGIKYKTKKYKFKGRRCTIMVCDDDDEMDGELKKACEH
jgi:hypothetical protein